METLKDETVIVKVGSNLIASRSSRDRGVNRDVVRSVALQACILINEHNSQVGIVNSGAVGVGFFKLTHLDRGNVIHKQTAAAAGQPEITDAFKYYTDRAGLVLSQYLVRADDLLNTKQPLLATLKGRGIPLINDNDPVNNPEAEKRIIVGDNDELAFRIALMVGATKLFLLTSVDGVFDPNGHIIPIILPDEQVEMRKDSKSELGTGGMESKVSAGQKAALNGITAYIANGRTPRVVLRILKGEQLGTKIPPY